MEKKLASPSLYPRSELPFPKRIAADLVGWALSQLSARHAASWTQAFELGEKQGHGKGRAAGKAEGYEKGYGEGFAAGRMVLEIRDARGVAGARPGVDGFLFDDWELPITAETERSMRADVIAFLPEHKRPTEDQWKMILSRTPSTYVIAGAGSGKSTTLILRILLLHRYLKFELDSMTVVTFTKKSQIDFVVKLRQTAEKWGVVILEDTAHAVVCTFHSKILKFIRALMGEHVVPFEFYGDKSKEDSAVATPDSPFDTRINEHQRVLLNGCYTELYHADERFRKLIGDLYYHSLTIDARNLDNEVVQRQAKAIKYVAERDPESMDMVEAAWKAAGQWPIACVAARRETIQIQRHRFQVHGRVKGMEEIAVVLRPAKFPGEDAKRPGSDHTLVSEMSVKKTICDALSNEKIVWLDTAADIETFVKWSADRAAIAPGFSYQVSGELASVPLLDCFVGAAAFIENLGLNVAAAVAGMKFAADDPDRIFFEALATFWPKFTEHLGKQVPRVMTFNQIFSLFGEGSGDTLKLLPDSLLRSMSHLMIDEFQDISPQIVSWVRAVLREVRRRGRDLGAGRATRHSSLLCVGDDWQSIYGWRGSSPKYFIEFRQEFPSPATTPIMLRENFRSHQHVIDAAEHVVAPAPSIPGKRARSGGRAAEGAVPVHVLDQDDAELARLAAAHYDAGETVMVLYREGGTKERDRIRAVLGSTWKADRKLPEEARRLDVMTFHKSKGLEAETVFLLGDCRYKTSSPFKNQAYRLAKLGGLKDPCPYDTAQEEELLRLAYVGITRAAKHCYWMPGREKHPSSKPKASGRLASAGPCFKDLRAIR
ncbi:MAG: UvrD-helicase domain-containing protein [Burkholderiaceae bacterium]|nr:UvrD-helicase domain-containing protein [Burkholderiaceae bacterium]